MRSQVTKVQVTSIVPYLNLDKECPTLDSAYETMKRHIPAQKNYAPVTFKVITQWDDGDKLQCMVTLSYAMEERHAHPRQAIFKKMACYAGIAQPQSMTAEEYRTHMALNALDGDVDALNQECLKWMLSHDIGYGDDYGREITAEELADLPEAWENSKVDTTKYFDCALVAWEVRDWMYEHYKATGGRCQVQNGKYYIA